MVQARSRDQLPSSCLLPLGGVLFVQSRAPAQLAGQLSTDVVVEPGAQLAPQPGDDLLVHVYRG